MDFTISSAAAPAILSFLRDDNDEGAAANPRATGARSIVNGTLLNFVLAVFMVALSLFYESDRWQRDEDARLDSRDMTRQIARICRILPRAAGVISRVPGGFNNHRVRANGDFMYLWRWRVVDVRIKFWN